MGHTLTIANDVSISNSATLSLNGGTIDFDGNVTLGNITGTGTIDVRDSQITYGVVDPNISIATNRTTIMPFQHASSAR